MNKFFARVILSAAIGVGIVLPAASTARASGPGADTMAYFYGTYTALQPLDTGNTSVPSFKSVQGALEGDFLGQHIGLYNQLGPATPVAGTEDFNLNIYDAAEAEYEQEMATYNAKTAQANAVENILIAAEQNWGRKLNGVARAAYAALSGYDGGYYASNEAGNYVNIGIPWAAANIILDTDFLMGVRWFQIPPFPKGLQNPNFPNPPSFAFVLANLITYSHLDPEYRDDLSKAEYAPFREIMNPTAMTPLGDYDLPPSEYPEDVVTKDQLEAYKINLQTQPPPFSYPPTPANPNFESVNANVNLASPSPSTPSPVTTPPVPPPHLQS